MKKIFENLKQFLLTNYKFLIGLFIIYLLFTIELPFVVYKPGGLVNLNDRVTVEDASDSRGSFSMCYVSMMKGTLPALGLSYLFNNWDIIPKDEITIDNGSVDDLLTLEKLYMQEAVDNATLLAYQQAGKEINITKKNNNVIYITKEADTNIKLYDQIIEVEGISIDNINDLKDIVSNYHENDILQVKVLRKGKEVDCTAKVYNLDGSHKLGIATLVTYEYETDPKINVKIKKSESGSSGGLMLTLAIYNKITNMDLTHGEKIVGTGTIDIKGNVGEIDGVKYKLLGAVKNKADVFLCPMENYDEALKVKEENHLDIIIKGVGTFDEALNYLQTR